jgi:hypothetical protein
MTEHASDFYPANLPPMKAIHWAAQTATKGTRLRCAWEVTAGIIPGTPEDSLCKRWLLTSEAWEDELRKADELGDAEGPIASDFARFGQEAFLYAQSLQDPRRTNWVKVDWIWL